MNIKIKPFMHNNNGYAICFNEWLFDKNIKSELNLLLLISSLCAEKGYCWASNEYFSNIFEIDTVSVSRKIKKLEDIGHVKITYEKRGCEIVRREIRLTKMLIHDIQKGTSTINKNVKDNNTIINNTMNNNSSPKKGEGDTKDIFISNLTVNKDSPIEEVIIKKFHNLFIKVRTVEGKKFTNKILLNQKVSSWKSDLDKIMRVDKVSVEDLKAVYNFLENGKDDFWRNTISSLNGLRKNYDKIWDKIRLEDKQSIKKAENDKKDSDKSVFIGNIYNVSGKKK